jgi:hypothetical protein
MSKDKWQAIKTANRSQAKISEHVSDNVTKIQTYSGYMVK